jgi:hypothetical protein
MYIRKIIHAIKEKIIIANTISNKVNAFFFISKKFIKTSLLQIIVYYYIQQFQVDFVYDKYKSSMMIFVSFIFIF